MLKLGELVGFLRVDDSGMDEGLDRGESKFKAFGDKLSLAAAAAGAAAALALGAALASAMETDAAQTKLAAQLGSAEWAEELGAVAGNLYMRGFGDTAEEGMQAVRAVMQSGLLMEDAEAPFIEEMTRQTQALAKAWDLDVTAATRAAGQMMRNGLAPDAQTALDILTRGFQQTGDQAGDLLDSFDEYSTQFRKLGLSGAQAMGLMAQGAKGGARDLDVVADALKEFAIRSADGTKASAEGFEAIGLNAEKMTAIFAKGGPGAAQALDMVLGKIQAMKDPVAREAAAIGLFGTKAEDLQAALMDMDLSTATDQLGKLDGAAKKTADTFEESSGQKLEVFKRQVQAVLVDQVAKAIPYLEKTAHWIQENEAIVRPLVTALGALAIVIGVVVAITKIYTAVQAALNIVMAMNPLGLIVIAIIAIIAGLILLWQNSETFRDIVTGVFGAVWGAIKFVWDWIKENWPLLLMIITGPIGIAVGMIIKHWDTIKAAAAAAWNWIVEKIKAFINFYLSMPGRITAGAKNMFTGLVNAAKGAINMIIRAWNAIDFAINVRVPDWVPGFGGKGFSIADVVPDIPMLAKGGIALREGLAMVGDAGPELLHLPRGAAVEPLPSTFGRGRYDGTGGAVRVHGELLVRGDGLLSGLRDRVRINGGDVQADLGYGSYVGV